METAGWMNRWTEEYVNGQLVDGWMEMFLSWGTGRLMDGWIGDRRLSVWMDDG